MSFKTPGKSSLNAAATARRPSAFKKLAILFFILGLICASPIGTVIYVVGLISVIGLPLSLLVLAIPNLAILIVTSFLIWRFVPKFERWGKSAAGLAALSVMVLIPLLHNAGMKAKASALRKNDVNQLAEMGPSAANPSKILGIAVLDKRPLCSALCLHLLTSGQASSVIISSANKGDISADMTAPAYKYSFEKQADCPARRNLRSGARVSRTTAERQPNSIAAQYFRRIDEGYCLQVDEAVLAEADTVVMMIRRSDFPNSPIFSPLPAKFSASRSLIYQKDKGKLPALKWQQTAINYNLLQPVLLFTIHVPAGLSGAKGGLWRVKSPEQKAAFRSISELLESLGYNLPSRLV